MDDPAVSAWSLWHFTESVLAGRNPYFTRSIFYPVGAHILHPISCEGFFPLTLLVKIITGGSAMYPFYAYRITVLASFVLLLYFSYSFLRVIGMTGLAAATAAIAYAFHRFFIDHIPHLSIVAGFFIPLIALILVRLYRKPGRARLLVATIVTGSALYFTEFVFQILLGMVFLFAIVWMSPETRREFSGKLRLLGARTFLMALAVFALIIAPAIFKQLSAGVLNPPAIESSNFSANVAGLLVPNPQRTPLYGKLFASLTAKPMIGVGGLEVFIGFPLLAFGAIGAIVTKQRLIRIAAIVSLLFFVLSLGPTLKVLNTETGIRLPYVLLMKVPPFDLSRTPARFVAMGLFFLMIAAAAGISWMQRSLSQRGKQNWGAAAAIAILIWTAAEAYAPPHPQSTFVPPPELTAIVPGPVVNLPLSRFDGYALLLQVFHHQPIATGYTSRYSIEQINHVNTLEKIIDKGGPRLCDELGRAGFRNIVVAPVTELDAPFELSECSLNVIDLRKPAANLPLYSRGTRIDFSQPDADRYLFYGWSNRESISRWTDRGRAVIGFALDETRDSSLRIRLTPFLVPGRLDEQRVNVKLNGQNVGALNLNQTASNEYSIALPKAAFRKENALIFELPDAESPMTVAVSEDSRRLGISVEWIEID